MIDQAEKKSPEVETQVDLASTPDLSKYVKHTINEADRDLASRSEWWNYKIRDYRRRYTMDHRNPTFPWPGSSDLVLPIVDMVCERLKSSYISYVKQSPKASFEANTPESYSKARNAELYFDYILNFQCNDFVRQTYLLSDSIVQNGVGIAKVLWQYDTINASEVLTRENLPDRFKTIMVQEGMTEKQAQEIYLASQGRLNPLTKETFDKIIPQVREAAYAEFGLVRESKKDKKQVDKIVSLLRGETDKITIKRRVETNNKPRMVNVPVENVILPPYTTCIEDAQRIVHRLFFTESALVARARDSMWDEDAVSKTLESGPSASPGSGNHDIRQFRNMKDGISDNYSGDLYEIWEVYAYWDIDNDGYDEKVVMTINPNTEGVLRIIELPYAHGQWPFIGIPFELNEDRFYSHRGVPEKINDLAEEIIAQHRAKLNASLMATSMNLKYRLGSHINPANWTWQPGQMLPVINMNDVEPVQLPDVSHIFREEENTLRAWIEQYMGSTDFALSGPTGSINDARTAREISAVLANKEQSLSVRSILWVDGLKRIYGQMWDLIQQYGPRNVIYRTTQGEVFKATKDEIMGNYDVVPNAPVGASDPGLQSQMDLARIQVLTQMAPILSNDPRWILDLGQAGVQWLERADFRMAKRILRPRTPQEQAQLQAQQAEMQDMAKRQAEAEIAAKMGAASGSLAGAQSALASIQPPQPEGINIPPEGIGINALAAQLGGSNGRVR